MADSPTENDPEYLSPADMRSWLQREVRELSKAFELRVKDATEFVTAYALGELMPEQANERMRRYIRKWGDSPIPGVVTNERMTNEEIEKRLDEMTEERLTRWQKRLPVRKSLRHDPSP